jgi:hypothetical protein
MAHPEFVDGREALQIWRVAANILNKQSQTACRRCSFILEVRQKLKLQTLASYRMFHRTSD